MELPIYQVDAFTSEIFGGNPAAIVPLKEWLPDELMQNIAIENNYSETAFFIPHKDSFYLRWFTPTYEIDLCGHATLATSHVILKELYPNRDEVKFYTNVAGELIVTKQDDSLEMDFPSRPGEKVDLNDIPEIVSEGLHGIKPTEAYKARDLMLIFDDEEIIKLVKPDFSKLIQYPHAVIITSESKEADIDFVSRFLCAYDFSIPEDPVTGSAHCTLTPYWADKLKKSELKAYQASLRGGNLECRLNGDRVYIKGQTKLYLKGTIYV
jgi:PhzF family phenazine biosynthesis protein